MDIKCGCKHCLPAISDSETPESVSGLIARHDCSHCGAYLFDYELSPGVQLIATEEVTSIDGKHVIPKGRLLRITAFTETPSGIGLLFCGLLGAGAFSPISFSAKWDIFRLMTGKVKTKT